VTARLHAYVGGRVQGVGFRDFVARAARPLELAGFARNLDDGRVEIVVEGERAACESLLATLRSEDPPGFIGRVDASWEEPTGEFGFRAS
jgi:acylphosphatase